MPWVNISYELKRELGRGAMGIIFEVSDSSLGNRPVAMKVIQNPDDQSRREFIKEGIITGFLQHPNIVPVHYMGKNQLGQDYYVMKIISGDDLKKVLDGLEKNRPEYRHYDLLALLRIFCKVCEAVAYAHAKGVIHRDLKPANIMIGKYGEVLVVDWGLAKIVGRENQDQVRNFSQTLPIDDTAFKDKTISGEIAGTPVYMSPEQAIGDNIDHRSDIWSLGVILYRILTGQMPFGGKSTLIVLKNVVEQPLPLPRTVKKTVPAELEAIVIKALRKAREERYQSAADLLFDVQRYLDGGKVSAYKYRLADEVKRTVKKHPAKVLSSAVATVLVLFFGVIFAAYSARAEKEKREETALRLTAEEKARQEADARANVETQRREALEKRALAFAQYQKGLELYNRRQFDLAIEQFSQAAATDPSFQEAFYTRGEVYRDLWQAEQAIADFKQSYELAQTQGVVLAKALYNIGFCYMEILRDLESAKQVFGRISEIEQTDVYGWLMTAQLDVLMGDFESALKKVEQAEKVAPYYCEIYNIRGSIYLKYAEAGQPAYAEQALAAFSKAIELNPRDYKSYNDRAILRMRLRDAKGALLDYDVALLLCPRNPFSLNNRGNIRKEMGRYEEALQDYNRAVELAPDYGSPYDGRGSVQLELGKRRSDPAEQKQLFDLAGQDFDRAIQLNVPTAYLNKGVLLYLKGEFDQAIESIQKGAELSPMHRDWAGRLIEEIRQKKGGKR